MVTGHELQFSRQRVKFVEDHQRDLARRIVLPIQNTEGEIVAYGGRWAEEPTQEQPKYKLALGFKKTAELSNLHRAIQESPEQPLAIVEGFFDAVIAATNIAGPDAEQGYDEAATAMIQNGWQNDPVGCKYRLWFGGGIFKADPLSCSLPARSWWGEVPWNQ